MKQLWKRLVDVVVHRILGLDDTPHRIAWGVLLGTVVAFTPTIGFQIAIYVTLATLLRANKISGIPVLFVSNPFTAIPLYWFIWRVGALLVPGGDTSAAEIRTQLRRMAQSDLTWQNAFTWSFWGEIGRTVVDMGVELWIGSFVIGLLAGIPLFFVSYWGVMEYRRRTWHRHHLRPPKGTA